MRSPASTILFDQHFSPCIWLSVRERARERKATIAIFDATKSLESFLWYKLLWFVIRVNLHLLSLSLYSAEICSVSMSLIKCKPIIAATIFWIEIQIASYKYWNWNSGWKNHCCGCDEHHYDSLFCQLKCAATVSLESSAFSFTLSLYISVFLSFLFYQPREVSASPALIHQLH